MRKVVVTGLGIVSPLGIGLETNWKAVQEGKSGISPIFLFDDPSGLATQFAGQVPDFDAALDDGTRGSSLRPLSSHGCGRWIRGGGAQWTRNR